ncbi:glutamate racemase [Paenibacillus sanguinis]|uniref:glutamate racemase n=1 Tax=Paenibacillus sanguinis TaxID=225906 RepID=UPI00035DFD2A|nr:glutamate racemase [Paenibacillus sanguinis]
MNIAFFDSGIGGLTVLQEAMRRLPGENFLYFADTLHVPYGTKTLEEVKRYVQESVQLVMKEPVQALVVACNTGTSAAIEELRSTYDHIPVIGMEPAVKPAVRRSHEAGRRVLVFATELTLSLSKYHDLVDRVDDHKVVDSMPLPELVQYCEQLQFAPQQIEAYFRGKLGGINLDVYGTIVLGCTHFPYYKNILRHLLPPHIELIDGTGGTVDRLCTMLGLPKVQPEEGASVKTQASSPVPPITFMCSDRNPAYLDKMARALAYLQSLQA